MLVSSRAAGAGELVLAASAFDRQKSAEVMLMAWQTRAYERGEHGARAGQHGDGQVFFAACAHQAVAGIRQAGHSRIGHHGHVQSARHALAEFGGARCFVVLVKTDERLLDLVMLQQHARVAGVLGGDEIGRPKRLEGAQGDVAQVSDRAWGRS